jgi:hypothetical protein
MCNGHCDHVKMKQHKYERIDKGQKRTKRAPQPRTKEGVYLPVCSPEKRQEIMQDAVNSLTKGETTDAIAARYNIDGSTLRRWLLTDDLADFARKTYFDGELATARQEIRAAPDPFTLARAREDFRAVAWLAERRLPAFYGQSHHLTVENVGDLGEKLRRSRERVIEGETVAQIPNAALLPPAKQETDIS